MRTNEKVTVLASLDNAKVRVDYFCLSDGKPILWNDQVNLPIGWLHAKVKVDLLEFTEQAENQDSSMDVKVCRLHINDAFIGEVLGAEVKETDSGPFIKYKVAVCYG